MPLIKGLLKQRRRIHGRPGWRYTGGSGQQQRQNDNDFVSHISWFFYVLYSGDYEVSQVVGQNEREGTSFHKMNYFVD